MNQVIAIPLFGQRVAPRCSNEGDFMIAQLENGALISSKTIHLSEENTDDWIDELIKAGINIFICGGIEREYEIRLQASHIQVIGNVAGDVNDALQAFTENRLESWFGYKECKPEKPHQAPSPCLVDCIRCEERTCQHGHGCVALTELDAALFAKPSQKEFPYSIYLTSLTGAPIARMEDLLDYCTSLKCERVGIVFCTAVFNQMETMISEFKEALQILPICCQFGCQREHVSSDPSQPLCDPDSLVSILNDAGCDLIITMGPCAQFNAAIDRHSRAPVITTMAKDRMAGGNLFPSSDSCDTRFSWRKEHCFSESK